MGTKIPSEIIIDDALLAASVALILQETLIDPILIRLAVLETLATEQGNEQGEVQKGIDGLRVALQEWANVDPPEGDQ